MSYSQANLALEKSPLPQTTPEPLHQRYWFIFNPAANRGKARRWVKPLQAVLKANQIDTVIQLTTQPNDATAFAEAARRKVEVVVACGGDGTFNEVAQSLIYSETPLGCIPLGSGNDFYSNLSGNTAPRRLPLDNAVRKVLNQRVQTIDTGAVLFQSQRGKYQRAFLNSMGIGFTGEIARVAKSVRYLRGDLIYLYALWWVGRTHRAAPMTIELTTPTGQQTCYEQVFSIMIGNGKREGGKFWIAPEAEMNDGWLDICILKEFPIWQLPKWVYAFLRGKHIYTSQVIYTKVKAADIHLLRPESMHLDGEVFEQVSGTVSVQVVPQSLNVIAVA
ncbi:MAG: YegS/Rv2252/BmrU family lipid kinase [Chloroherpetonaceae bacterium]|nr:YegS/Rv2252/BmrU family lipid kinase [Chloroherpetonaceae bacterium]MCS7212192.1 YegS/Rv2252/BmrU family lipid kinase [Chloroherpetonaceae bacterium]MDW8018804.1 YegS/Rv2252/BmrU family lipid kinase [Chloroherpetonaceae bacterium]MDW8467241.1 YegS/Rv2252/BmrU family lipid kinase [Chloroherpetonaceae bacterium]